jgi:hypothetical protein
MPALVNHAEKQKKVDCSTTRAVSIETSLRHKREGQPLLQYISSEDRNVVAIQFQTTTTS